MEKNTLSSLTSERNALYYTGLVLTGLVTVLVLALLICVKGHAQQSLIWPTPESHGVVRDLTHLPAVPFYQMDPTNLNDLLWSQPGSAYSQSTRDPYWVDAPIDPRSSYTFGDPGYAGLNPKAWAQVRTLMQGIINDFERQTR